VRLFEGKKLFKSLSDGVLSDDLVLSRRHRPDYQIVALMAILMFIGLIVVYAIGPQRANVLNNAYGSHYSDTYFFIKQLVSLLIATLGFVFMAIFPFKTIAKYSKVILISSLALCLLLAVANIANLDFARSTLGGARWFDLGSLGSFQPSEALKIGLLVFISLFLGNKIRQGRLNSLSETIIPLGIMYGVSMFFVVVAQNDLGTGIAITGIIAAMLLVGKINLKNSLIIAAVLLSLVSLVIVVAPHRMERIMTFIGGDSQSATADSSDDDYHIKQAKLAIGTGGLFGVGIGNSVQATGYLPEAINDSVFAIIGETFGLVGLVTILALFTILLVQLLKIMDHLEDIRLKLVVAGIFGWVATHVMLNVASMIGLVPLTGITLPMLSFGGTSMIFIAAALGLVFQLSNYTTFSSNIKEAKYENIGSRRGIGRACNASRSRFRRD
jgi:cell division protein FtsW